MPFSDLLLFLALVLSSLPTASLAGQVRTPDGTPVPRVRVVLREGKQLLASTVTDDRGRYRLAGLAPGLRTGGVILARSTFPFQVRVTPGAHPFDITLGLKKWSLVRGRVLSPEGEQVEGAKIELDGESRRTSDREGNFLLLAAAGTHKVLARKGGYVATQQEVELTAGSLADCELRLDRGATLHGRLLGLSAEELAQATVQVARRFEPNLGVFVQEDGTYQMTGLPPGKGWVRGWSHGKHAEAEVVLVEGEEKEMDLAFPYPRVSGRALDEEGHPVADRDLAFRSGQESATVHTSASGRFEVDLHTGEYWVNAAEKGGAEPLAAPEPLVVKGDSRKELEVRLVAATSSLLGQLLGFDSAELNRTGIEVTQSGRTQFAFVDTQGRYELHGLLPGEWELSAWSGDLKIKGKVQVPRRGAAHLDFAFPFDPAAPRQQASTEPARQDRP
jgi:hypothetical protein